MRKIALILAGMLMLVGCGSSPDAQEIPDCTHQGMNGSGCVVTIQYKGKPIDCITWSGSHSETGLTCDFVKYHQEK